MKPEKRQKEKDGRSWFGQKVHTESRMIIQCSKKEEKTDVQHRLKRAYPSDLTDAQWEILHPLIPPVKSDAAYHLHERREIVNAILYVLRSGCPWRSLPHDFPAWGTVYYYFRRWQREGVWDHV